MTDKPAVRPVLLLDWGNTLMREIPGFAGPMANWPRVEAIPNARETLASLRGAFLIALATNAQSSDEPEIRQALARVRLDREIERVFGSRAVGHRKPEPEFFRHVLDELGLRPSHAVMVGDSLENDVLGPNVCGIRAVWFNEARPETREGPLHTTIHALSELPVALGRLVPDLISRQH